MDEDVNYAAPPTVMDIETSLRYVKYWETELEKRRTHADEEINKAKTWLALQEDKITAKINWHLECIHQHMEKENIKSGSFINGRVSIHKGRERIEVHSEQDFLEWYNRHKQNNHQVTLTEELINTTEIVKPNKKAIKEFIKLTGEIPEGTELCLAPEKLVIEADGAMDIIDT